MDPIAVEILVTDPIASGFDYCSCYTNIILPIFSCCQPTRFCQGQLEAVCLNRTIKYDLLELQKTHAVLQNDTVMVAKAERQLKSFFAREFKNRLKNGTIDRLNGVPASIENKKSLSRNKKNLMRRTMEEKLGPRQVLKRMEKENMKDKAKESRKKQLTMEMSRAEAEFEKARLKKLENEEKRKEANIKNIKPKKKGPKTHFRKSKKPGRA